MIALRAMGADVDCKFQPEGSIELNPKSQVQGGSNEVGARPLCEYDDAIRAVIAG